jgi:hypothetical protein
MATGWPTNARGRGIRSSGKRLFHHAEWLLRQIGLVPLTAGPVPGASVPESSGCLLSRPATADLVPGGWRTRQRRGRGVAYRIEEERQVPLTELLGAFRIADLDGG